MSIFSHSDFDGHEQVCFFSDKQTGLRAIVAIHNTNLGPALGGCRMWNYATDDEALTDALRLSRGMTYKAAMANLPLGGGKSVIIGNSQTQKTPELLRAMGDAVEKLGGRYIIAEDVGTSVEDMCAIQQRTQHVAGLPAKTQVGSDRAGGDPSPVTAFGVFTGIRAAIAYRLDRADLSGLTVAVQGLGHVGYHLCKQLHEAGANLIVTDIRQDKIHQVMQEFGARAVALEDIYSVQADVFAPCALGAVLNDETIPQLKVQIVAGSSNNQLAEERHGKALMDRGILYAPDYVINAGGLINAAYEQHEKILPHIRSATRQDALNHVAQIQDTLQDIFVRAEKSGIPTSEAADRIAEKRFGSACRESSSQARSCGTMGTGSVKAELLQA